MIENMLSKISSEEDKRSDELMKLLQKHEAIVEALKKELRKIIYKLDRKV